MSVPVACPHGVVLIEIPGEMPEAGAATQAWLNEHVPPEFATRLRTEKCQECR